jgi:hypothetical protein
VIEVFDEKRHLMLRQDYSRYSSPISADEERWPIVRIAPGGRVRNQLAIWQMDLDFGKPVPGTYFVRLLFPFEKGVFYGSNLKEFQVQ